MLRGQEEVLRVVRTRQQLDGKRVGQGRAAAVSHSAKTLPQALRRAWFPGDSSRLPPETQSRGVILSSRHWHHVSREHVRNPCDFLEVLIQAGSAGLFWSGVAEVFMD